MRRGRTVEKKNVFSDRLNREYDHSAVRKSAGKLFHTLVVAAAKVLSPKQLEYMCLSILTQSVEQK